MPTLAIFMIDKIIHKSPYSPEKTSFAAGIMCGLGLLSLIVQLVIIIPRYAEMDWESVARSALFVLGTIIWIILSYMVYRTCCNLSGNEDERDNRKLY